MKKKMPSVQTFLSDALEAAQKRNSRFSMRSFAKMIEVSPSHLSLILSNKKKLSIESAINVAGKLNFSADQTRLFVLLVESELTRGETRTSLEKKASALWSKIHAKRIKPEENLYRLKWQHLLVLVALEIDSFTENDLKKLEELVSVSKTELNSILKDLKKAGLVVEGDGSIMRTHQKVVIEPGTIYGGFQNLHLSYLERLQTLVKNREATDRFSVTEFLAISPDKFAKARSITEDYLDEMTGLCDADSPEGLIEIALHLNFRVG